MSPVGYSGTPLPKKLGIKERMVVAVIDGPDHLDDLLVPLPEADGASRVAWVVTAIVSP